MLGCFLAAFLLFHGVAVLLGCLLHRVPLGELADLYLSDRVLMTGFLCTCWFVGYNLVSYAIWSQFEASLERDAPPDDFEFVDTGAESGDWGPGTGSSVGLGKGGSPGATKLASQTLLVTMPSGELVIGTNTRAHPPEAPSLPAADK